MNETEAHRQFATECFNRVWALLDDPQRTAEHAAEMVHTAHASLYHWMQVGEPVNLTRGEWQCSRVYSVLGRAEPAQYHAQRALLLCQRNGIADFDIAFAYEALARAHAVAGERDLVDQYVELARKAADSIADPEDRDLLIADLETIPE